MATINEELEQEEIKQVLETLFKKLNQIKFIEEEILGDSKTQRGTFISESLLKLSQFCVPFHSYIIETQEKNIQGSLARHYYVLKSLMTSEIC